jgi:hypothetical protein
VLGVANLLARCRRRQKCYWSLLSFLRAPDPKLHDQVQQHGLTGLLGFGKRPKG